MTIHPFVRNPRTVAGALCALALATSGLATLAAEEVAANNVTSGTVAAVAPRLALDGYCPVSITGDKTWTAGDPAVTEEYDGCLYRFATAEHRERFLESPETFAPALAGDCIVTWQDRGRRVPGELQFGAFYAGRLFLFADAGQREAFRANIGVLGTTDLAYDGRCPVALVDGRLVRGEPEFLAQHHGFLYLFASEAARNTFLANPQDFAFEAKRDELLAGENTVEATGKSACAFCDHKIWPLLTKDELGFAVEAADGTLYIVEHADTRFPTLYENRFAGGNVKVTGREIRREGKTVWLVPTSLEEAT